MEYLKERWKEMDRGRRIVLLIQPALFLLALVLFLTLGRQRVLPYLSTYLRCEQQGETVLYSGRTDGYQIQYAVKSPAAVEFWRDGALEGAYEITEDPTAIPEEPAEMNPYGWEGCTGIEIKKNGETWFRGAYNPDSPLGLYDEDGTNQAIGIIAVGPSYVPEPDPGDVLYFAGGPETSHRGNGLFLLLGLLVSVICAATLLFEDQLFRWGLSFRVQDPYGAEPSEWELFDRWVGWVVLTGLAVFVYATGSGLTPMF